MSLDEYGSVPTGMLSKSRGVARARVARRALNWSDSDDPTSLATLIVFFFLMLLVGIGLMLLLTPTRQQTIASMPAMPLMATATPAIALLA